MATTPTPHPELDAPVDVLAHARECRATADAAEAALFAAAATWAEQHPAESITDAAAWAGPVFTERPLTLAGPGAPLVAEFCLPELAAALGMSTDAGRALVAHAVETRHRLPRLWRRVMAGEVPTWRARRIAERTITLSAEAAAFVDAQVAGFAHTIGYAATQRLLTDAIARYMPAQAAADAQRAADSRHVTFHHTGDQTTGVGGTTAMEALLDAADARDLDHALAHHAALLKAAGCQKPLDVRRAMAAGDLARHQTTLDLTPERSSVEPVETTTQNATGRDPERSSVEPVETTALVSTSSTDEGSCSTDERHCSAGGRPRPRQVVLHVHLSAAALNNSSDPDCLHLARVEEGRRIVTADQIRTWCATPDTAVTVRPVIDLEDHLHVEAYKIPDRLTEQTHLRHHTCVFPWCTRPARSSDCDHVIAHSRGGPTCTCNLAPLCRRHHRLKTHATWTYTTVDGSYLWSSPHGYQFLVDHTGTHDITQTRPLAPPRPIHRPAAASTVDPPEH